MCTFQYFWYLRPLPVSYFYVKAAAIDLEVAVLGFGRVAHPPYSPDLAPFDFGIFPAIKSQLKKNESLRH